MKTELKDIMVKMEQNPAMSQLKKKKNIVSKILGS